MAKYNAGTDIQVTDTLLDSDNTDVTLSELLDLTFTAYSLSGEVIAQWSMNNAGGDVQTVIVGADDKTFTFNIESDITLNYERMVICGEATWTDSTLSDNIRNVRFDVEGYTFDQCQ